MMDPRYRDVKRSEIPEVSVEGGTQVKVVCGRVNGVQGPVRDIVTDPEYLDVAVPKGAQFTHPIGKACAVRRTLSITAKATSFPSPPKRSRFAFSSCPAGRSASRWPGTAPS